MLLFESSRQRSLTASVVAICPTARGPTWRGRVHLAWWMKIPKTSEWLPQTKDERGGRRTRASHRTFSLIQVFSQADHKQATGRVTDGWERLCLVYSA